MKVLIILVFLASALFAQVILPAGTCQSFLLFNESDNSTFTQEICAENATIIQNITNVTELACPATNTTIWANSSLTINNQTVVCLSNLTTIINNTVYVNQTQIEQVPFCNFTSIITPSSAIQQFTNISGLTITVNAVPQDFCFENIYINPASYQQVVRSDKCNITVVAPADNNSACPVCQTCQICQTCQVCTTPEPATCPAVPDCNSQVAVAIESAQNNSTNQVAYLQGSVNSLTNDNLRKDMRIHDLENTTAEMPTKIDEAVNSKLWALPTITLGAIFILLMIAGWVIWREREKRKLTPQTGGTLGMSKEDRERMSKAGIERGNPWVKP